MEPKIYTSWEGLPKNGATLTRDFKQVEVTDEGWQCFQPSSRKTLTVCFADGGQLECDVSNVEFKPGEPASITVQFPIEAGDVIRTKDGYFEAMRVFEDAKGNTWIDTMNGAYPRDNVLLSNGWSE